MILSEDFGVRRRACASIGTKRHSSLPLTTDAAMDQEGGVTTAKKLKARKAIGLLFLVLTLHRWVSGSTLRQLARTRSLQRSPLCWGKIFIGRFRKAEG